MLLKAQVKFAIAWKFSQILVNELFSQKKLLFIFTPFLKKKIIFWFPLDLENFINDHGCILQKSDIGCPWIYIFSVCSVSYNI